VSLRAICGSHREELAVGDDADEADAVSVAVDRGGRDAVNLEPMLKMNHPSKLFAIDSKVLRDSAESQHAKPNMPNVTVPNLNILMCHGDECNNVPKYYVRKCQSVDVIKCRMYQHAALQWTKPTNCRTTYYLLLTPPNWAALFSDNYPLRGVFRLGAYFMVNKLLG
jgi:hypothetical protein